MNLTIFAWYVGGWWKIDRQGECNFLKSDLDPLDASSAKIYTFQTFQTDNEDPSIIYYSKIDSLSSRNLYCAFRILNQSTPINTHGLYLRVDNYMYTNIDMISRNDLYSYIGMYYYRYSWTSSPTVGMEGFKGEITNSNITIQGSPGADDSNERFYSDVLFSIRMKLKIKDNIIEYFYLDINPSQISGDNFISLYINVNRLYNNQFSQTIKLPNMADLTDSTQRSYGELYVVKNNILCSIFNKNLIFTFYEETETSFTFTGSYGIVLPRDAKSSMCLFDSKDNNKVVLIIQTYNSAENIYPYLIYEFPDVTELDENENLVYIDKSYDIEYSEIISLFNEYLQGKATIVGSVNNHNLNRLMIFRADATAYEITENNAYYNRILESYDSRELFLNYFIKKDNKWVNVDKYIDKIEPQWTFNDFNNVSKTFSIKESWESYGGFASRFISGSSENHDYPAVFNFNEFSKTYPITISRMNEDNNSISFKYASYSLIWDD